MNRTETLGIMSVLKAAYPSYYRDMSARDANGIVSLWESMFSDESASLVAAAVKALIATDTKGFPPCIGAVKDNITKLRRPDEMTELEAWGLVSKALKNGYYGAEEEYRKLPDEIRWVIGSASQLRDWAMMETDTVNSVVASNFQRSYRERSRRERERLALPADVRSIAAQMADALKMPELEDGHGN